MSADWVEYKHDTSGMTAADLVDLWHSVGWIGFSDKYPQRLLGAMVRSDYTIAAWVADKLVGVCACMTNGLQTYVSQLCVHPDYQKKGVGTYLIDMVKLRYQDCEIILMTRNAKDFYLKTGFEVDETAIPMRVDNLGFDN